jgi:hypothetical protein
MVVDQAAGAPIDSVRSWAELTAWLPEMLEQLLASEVFHVGNRPPVDRRGIYLFSEAGEHLYVGRTGITARSRARGGVPITSFRHRFDQHTQPGRPPGASSFAKRLMLEDAAQLGLAVPDGWWDDRKTVTATSMTCTSRPRRALGRWSVGSWGLTTTLRACARPSPRRTPTPCWGRATTTSPLHESAEDRHA